MKTVFNQYGVALITVLVGIGVMAAAFGTGFSEKNGIIQTAGAKARADSVDFSYYRDFEAVKAVHERTKPKAFYSSAAGRLFVDTDTDLLSAFGITDFEGSFYSLRETVLTDGNFGIMFCRMLDIRDEEGNSCLSLYNAQDGHITFPKAGIYYVCFRTRDRENVAGIWKIPIAVDEKGAER